MKFDYFKTDADHLLDIRGMVDRGMTEGDFVYVLGYPMGIVAPDRQYAITRSGSIARIRDLLERRSNDFIVDAFVFPGNSGGPVVSKPEYFAIQGTKVISKEYLIEECAVMLLLAEDDYQFEIYPSDRKYCSQK